MDIHFFATKDDLIATLVEIQEKLRVKYVKTGLYESSKDIIQYRSILELSELGVNYTGDHSTDSYLILNEDDGIIARKVEQNKGGHVFFVDQGSNVDSIVLWPGGFFSEKCLKAGRIATISNTEKSKILFKLLSGSIKKNYHKISGTRYYVSSGVDDIKDEVRLITMTVKQPVEFDLKY